VTLLELATLGTEAFGGDVPEPLTGTGADALLAQRSGDPVERRVLLAAGCREVLDRAAAEAPPAPPPPPLAPDETRAPLPDGLVSALLAMLEGEGRDLLPAVLPRVAATGRILPPAALRPALRRCPDELRPLLAPLLGARARWLAEQGASWTWVLRPEAAPTLPALLAAFDEARGAERPALLRRIRALDSKAGRDALRAAWTSEPVEGRLALVAPLAVGLHPDDEPLLVQIVDRDRSERVRSAARRVLARIPASAFARELLAEAIASVRLVPRPAPRMSIVKAMFRRGAALPPTLEGTVSSAELLARLELVPPGALGAAWSLEPAEALAGLSDDDEALLVGLSEGALLHEASDWASPLLDRWDRMPRAAQERDRKGRDVAQRLLDALPDEARAARIVALMDGPAATDWWPPLAPWQAMWPEPLAARWVTVLRAHLATIDAGAGEATSAALTWRSSLCPAAARLPASQLSAAATLGVLSSEAAPRWSRALREFAGRVALRLSVEQALAALPPSPSPPLPESP
jgi:hypothetical protein